MSWWKHILPKNTSTCWMFPGLKHTSTLEPARSNGFVGDAVIINSFVWVTWGNIIIHLHDLVGFFFRVYPLQNYSMLSQRCLVSSCNYFCRKVCRRVLFQHAFWKKTVCVQYTNLEPICHLFVILWSIPQKMPSLQICRWMSMIILKTLKFLNIAIWWKIQEDYM